jgi:hypothetical protein
VDTRPHGHLPGHGPRDPARRPARPAINVATAGRTRSRRW